MRTAALVALSLSLSLSLSHVSSPAVANPRDKSPAELPGAREFKHCKKLPPGKRVLKLNLKPDSEVSDLVRWMSSISCTPFVFSAGLLQGRKVTVFSPQLLTPEEAYQLFIGALTSVDLTIEPLASGDREGGVLRVVLKPGPR